MLGSLLISTKKTDHLLGISTSSHIILPVPVYNFVIVVMLNITLLKSLTFSFYF